MQAVVGGTISAIYPYEEPVAVVCNDDAIYLNLPFNRSVEGGYGGVFGTFFICGLTEDNFGSLTPAQIKPTRKNSAMRRFCLARSKTHRSHSKSRQCRKTIHPNSRDAILHMGKTDERLPNSSGTAEKADGQARKRRNRAVFQRTLHGISQNDVEIPSLQFRQCAAHCDAVPVRIACSRLSCMEEELSSHCQERRKGIRILAPCPYTRMVETEKIDPHSKQTVRDANGNPIKETVVVQKQAFKVVTVFDISQTEGKELPTIGASELTGNVAQYERITAAITDLAPVPIYYDDSVLRDGAKGMFTVTQSSVSMSDRISARTQTLKTLIHETAIIPCCTPRP